MPEASNPRDMRGSTASQCPPNQGSFDGVWVPVDCHEAPKGMNGCFVEASKRATDGPFPVVYGFDTKKHDKVREQMLLLDQRATADQMAQMSLEEQLREHRFRSHNAETVATRYRELANEYITKGMLFEESFKFWFHTAQSALTRSTHLEALLDGTADELELCKSKIAWGLPALTSLQMVNDTLRMELDRLRKDNMKLREQLHATRKSSTMTNGSWPQ